MSKMQRTKGRAFEQAVARDLRQLWPGADIHRSSQAERAREPDVVLSGVVPPGARPLWLELQDAAAPTPLVKLLQAERDVAERAPWTDGVRLPVVVWHKLRERTLNVTTRLWVLNDLSGWTADRAHSAPTHSLVVTFGWHSFLEMLSALPLDDTAEAA